MPSELCMKARPWLGIPASDYEEHMGPEGADQLAVLNELFRDIYNDVYPKNLLVLGCGTGNGLEHVDRTVTQRAVGIDINSRYLEIARQRHNQLSQTMEFMCLCLEECDFKPASFDLIHAALMFEYVDPAYALSRIANWLKPNGVFSFAIQLPSGKQGVVTDTGVTSMQELEEVIQLVEPEPFLKTAARIGLEEKITWEIPLKFDKKFMAGLLIKP